VRDWDEHGVSFLFLFSTMYTVLGTCHILQTLLCCITAVKLDYIKL